MRTVSTGDPPAPGGDDGRLPAATLCLDPEEGPVPEGGSHRPAAVLLIAGVGSRQQDRATPETSNGRQGGKGPRGERPEQSWGTCLKDDVKAFGATRVYIRATSDFVFGVPKLV